MQARSVLATRTFAFRERALVLGALLLGLHSLPAQVPSAILNQASMEYSDPGPWPTNRVESNLVRVEPAAAVVPPPELHFHSDGTFGEFARAASVGQPVYLQSITIGCNANPLVAETNVISVSSQLTGDREDFPAVETAPNSGLFRILPGVPTRDRAVFGVTMGNGVLETEPNDVLGGEVEGCGTGRAAAVVVVDPGGIVFDSRSNRPVAGATVTVIDVSTGLPALVYEADGVGQALNPVVTEASGSFVFPLILPGSYRLAVLPPPGYAAPSEVPLNDLPSGRVVGFPGSYGGTFNVTLASRPLRIDIPVDPLAEGGTGLFVQKVASRGAAEVGDLVVYTVRVRNVTGSDLTDVKVTDRLPLGFAYQRGTARLAGLETLDPAGGAGPVLGFTVQNLAADATVTLSYVVRIGPGAIKGNGENTAQAESDGPPRFLSNVARARVEVVGGVFTDRGHLVGKVFVDMNLNRVQDEGEPGVPGVRLYLEDGTYVITDAGGKYDIYGLRAKTHVIQVDRISLPRGAALVELDSRNAGTPSSRFVDLKFYELHKANFALGPGDPAVMEEVARRRKEAGAAGAELEMGVRSTLTRDGTPQLTGDPRGLPASGVVRALPVAPAVPPVPPPAEEGPVPPTGDQPALPPGGVPAATNLSSSPYLYGPLLPGGTLDARNSNLPSRRAAGARIPLELSTEGMDNGLGFVDLKDGDTLPMRQVTVRVKGALGAGFILTVDGVEVPLSRVGKRVMVTERALEAWEFVGVGLRPGVNTLGLFQVDGFGNRRGGVELRVVAPDRLGRVRILLPVADQPADGQTPAVITVRLEDEQGVPVTARTPLTLEASVGQWQVEDLNKTEPGVQVVVEGGEAEFKLLPPYEPGEARVVVGTGAMSSEASLPFLPDLRPMLAVGLIEGRLSLRRLSRGAIEPSRSRDGFEEELNNFAASSGDGGESAAGRAAFFLKGRIKGEYLLTAGYDSDKDTGERLFRDIQPDEYYPVYGDDATKGYDAQSTGRLYVRIDKRRCYLLYGDYSTASASEARGLGNYSRSLTGIQEHYEKRRFAANLWASHDTTVQVIEEAGANGTSGPYFFSAQDGVVNSERVEIITRDRHQPSVILRSEIQTRFTDYEFEPFTGRILFRRPVPSVDSNLNPISIRVTFEKETGGEKFWVYGGDAQVKLADRWEVGGAGVRDGNPLAPYGLYSANTTYKVGQRTFVIGEVARSDVAGSIGDAARVEVRHQGEKTDARFYYGRADNTFSNAASVLSGGRVEAGVKVTQRLTSKDRLLVQAINSETTGPAAGSRHGALVGVEHVFTNQMRLEVGGRYSTETLTPASPSTSVPAGVTPLEVRSARMKFTTPVPLVRDASVFAEYENDLVETENRMMAFGGDYQVHQKTRIHARHELIDSIGGPFELNNFQRRNTTVVGLESEYMQGGDLFSEYRMREAISGQEAEAAIGLRNTWTVSEGLRLSGGFERVNPIVGAVENESTALTGGMEYTGSPFWKGSARLELRTATVNDSLLNTLGYARKLSEDWTFLGRTILYMVDDNGPSDADTVQARFQAGLAYRQTRRDRWHVLSKYEYKVEDGDLYSAADLRRHVHIFSLHANYQPIDRFYLSSHYAGKAAWEKGEDFTDTYHAHLLAFRVTFDITRHFDVGFNSAGLFDGGFNSSQWTVGPELGMTVKQNLRIGIGYNFTGFHDRDLSESEYTQEGVYLALRLKFDEETLGLGGERP